MAQLELGLTDDRPRRELAEGAWFLPGLALDAVPALTQDLIVIFEQAPLRHLVTPGGFTMSVAMTNCGELGWVSDSKGYRYVGKNPATNQPWPTMPLSFAKLAESAAAEVGYVDFVPNVCLINRYAPGARLTLHQDLNERNLDAPIVTVSLGLPAVFQFGGLRRTDPTQNIKVTHGDMVIWGGHSRMFFHGVLPVKDGQHPLVGEHRLSLTFRVA